MTRLVNRNFFNRLVAAQSPRAVPKWSLSYKKSGSWTKSDTAVVAASAASRRLLSTTTSSPIANGERLRVAVVGGGCAGLSSALHLAPLVEQGYLASPIDIYDATPSKGRSIGVGVWSTGLDPFKNSDRSSHQLVYDEMTTHGAWVGDAGYRTPDGSWLLKSHLPTSPEECESQNMPALLFLREKDMLQSLQKAIHWEERRGTVRVHRDGSKTRVTSLDEDSSLPWSSRLHLAADDSYTDRDYHLIVAADGTNSMLRQRYGGYNLATQRLIGTAGLRTQNDIPGPETAPWDDDLHLQATLLQDRNYTVFRGNAPLTKETMGEEGVSFQTWGTGKSMRFATVPMFYPGPLDKRQERQVWFATINDDEVCKEADPLKRRTKLIKAFSSWHDPICKTIESTPPEEILMERAVAHRHCIGPVISMNQVIRRIRGTQPPNAGEGPCVVFVGDAYMTIDPILAQGFTVAMEGAFATKNSVQKSCQVIDPNSTYAFDPYLLRKELKTRHEDRMDRLTCLLRATELVQALGQPQGGSLTGYLNTYGIRPLTRLTPNFIKKPFFNSVLKYSLGL